MEQEVDLLPYISSIIRKWYWVLASFIFFAIVGFVITLFLPSTYEATSFVAVPGANVLLLDSLTSNELDPSFTLNSTTVKLLRSFPELATSDDILSATLNELSLNNIDTIEGLRAIINAEAGLDSALLRFVVKHRNPETAAQIANVWAAVFIDWVNTLYGSSDQLAFFETELADALTALDETETTLVSFEQENRSQILANNLLALQQAQFEAQNSYLAAQTLLEDVALLEAVLDERSNTLVSFADQLTALNLQVRAFDLDKAATIQVQSATDQALIGETRAEQMAFLTGLKAVLNGRLQTLEMRLASLEPQILETQQALEENNVRHRQLLRKQAAAMETYTALTRRVEEERINLYDGSTDAQLFSAASVPTVSNDASAMLFAGVGGFVGLMLAVGVIAAMTWLDHTKEQDDE